MIDLDEALRDRGDRWRAAQPSAPELDRALEDLGAARRVPVRAMLAIAASVLVVAAVSVVWLRPTSIDEPAAGPVPSEVVARARAAAQGSVVEPNRIAAVETTYAEAAALMDGLIGQPSDEPVWIIEMTGSFVCHACPRPPAATAPQGEVLSLAVDAQSSVVSDTALTSNWIDLSPLGEVHELVSAPEVPANLAATVRGLDGLDHADVVRTSWAQLNLVFPIGMDDPPAHVWVVRAHGTFSGGDPLGPLGASHPGGAAARVEFAVFAEDQYGNVSTDSLAGQVGPGGGAADVQLEALGPVTTIRP